MRHRIHGRVLNVDTQHRLAMRRNLARSLFLHGRIVTTPAKAKAVRPFVERLITRARKALAARAAKDNARWIHEVRLLSRDITDKAVLRVLLSDVAPRANRPGGYTRIMRDWKNQVGDNAPRALFELVDRPTVAADAPEGAEGAEATPKGKGAKGGKPKGGAKKAPAAKGAKKVAAAAGSDA